MMELSKHKKLAISLRYWFLGMAETNPRYFDCARALDFAIKYHNDNRKDGSPTIIHQLSICLNLKTFYRYLIDPCAVFVTALLHDTYEDYPESESELLTEFPEYFNYIKRVSKVRNNEKIPYSLYFSEMQDCHVCSVVKLADRIHNLSTMVGAFSIKKQKKYISEVDEWFLPMLKYSKRKYIAQEPVYENFKMVLEIICNTISKCSNFDN